ncbi:hypothetical protein ACET3Z_017900 [Daucus carota]
MATRNLFPTYHSTLLFQRCLASLLCFYAVTNHQSHAFDYRDALSKSILYFEGQRSGYLPPDQRVTWRHHSGLSDGFRQGVDLVGGYYDAGDNVKFGLPMAFTITLLSWSVIEYGKQISDAGEYHHALEAIKWGTDYFLKSHTEPNVLWGQVGDGRSDHGCWQRPEDMTTERDAYKIDEKHPGSDLAGETAAALAASSIVFRGANPYYSNILLQHAKELFEFADKFRGKYDDSIEVVKGYYPSLSGYKDELLWAALWLYKATGEADYYNYVLENAHSFGGIGWEMTEFSWDVKYAGVQVMASMLLKETLPQEQKQILHQYHSKAKHFICACLNKNKEKNLTRTPGGLMFIRPWNNLQYVTTATFLLTVYSDHLKLTNQELSCYRDSVGPDEMASFAKSQVDYILGSNPMRKSYLVGYGPVYPERVHHRGASTVSYKVNTSFIGCIEGYHSWYGHQAPNPNVLIGAVVGGPDKNDGFEDRRGNFMQSEACTYNTAPLVGVFAKLYGSEKNSMIFDS